MLDLHGLSAVEARAVVLCALGRLQAEFADTGATPTQPLLFITGRGKNSSSGQCKLRPAVAELCNDLGLMITDAPVDSRGRQQPPPFWGYLQISVAELTAWLERGAAKRKSRAH